MKKTFTLSMTFLHTWGGLVMGWLLFGVLLTGSIAVFQDEINLWAVPEIRTGLNPDRATTLQLGVDHLNAQAPDARMWRIDLPRDRDPQLIVAWTTPQGKTTSHTLDPVSGGVIERKTQAGAFYLAYHYMLGIDRNENLAGFMIVGLSGIFMIAACVSGIVIHKRIFKDLFLFRPNASGQRAWLDMHNVLGVLPLPFHLMMAYTGIVILYWIYIPAAVQTLYAGDSVPFRAEAIALEYRGLKAPAGEPAAMLPLPQLMRAAETSMGADKTAYIYVRDPNRGNAVFDAYRDRDDRVTQQVEQVALDGVTGAVLRIRDDSAISRVQSYIAALHFVEWGGAAVRWAYGLAGMASTGMVAAGLVVFTEKRRRKAGGDAAWLTWVDKINVAAVAGISVACVALLWAERLTPVFPERAQIPVLAFYWTWAAMALHAALRPPRKAWGEQFVLAGLLCLGAPLLGGQGWRHLAALDGVRMGMDATLIGTGLLCLAGVWILHRRARAGPCQPEAAEVEDAVEALRCLSPPAC